MIAVNLEGVAMTLPEVQTILDGITVAGHKISDQNMAINQAKAWEYLFELLNQNLFQFDKKNLLKIHEIAAKEEEALEWGQFRNGFVTIAGSDYEPPAPKELNAKWHFAHQRLPYYQCTCKTPTRVQHTHVRFLFNK